MKGLLDFLQAASNGVASNVSGPVDLIGAGLNKIGLNVGAAPVGGSEWMKRQGLMRDVQQGPARVLGETAGLLGPALATQFAPQIARGLLQVEANAMKPRKLNNEAGVVVASLSKRGDPREAGAFVKDAIAANNGQMPYDDIAKMTREEFTAFYDNLAPHHQGKFDRLLRAYSPQYDDLPTTMKQYADDFKYENPRIVSQFSRVKPEDTVDVFRSVSKADPDTAIVPGDWIALERSYAKQHGRLGDDAPRLLKTKVPAKDVRWAGTSADEYFYVPSGGVDPSIGTKYDALLKSRGIK